MHSYNNAFTNRRYWPGYFKRTPQHQESSEARVHGRGLLSALMHPSRNPSVSTLIKNVTAGFFPLLIAWKHRFWVGPHKTPVKCLGTGVYHGDYLPEKLSTGNGKTQGSCSILSLVTASQTATNTGDAFDLSLPISRNVTALLVPPARSGCEVTKLYMKAL